MDIWVVSNFLILQIIRQVLRLHSFSFSKNFTFFISSFILGGSSLLVIQHNSRYLACIKTLTKCVLRLLSFPLCCALLFLKYVLLMNDRLCRLYIYIYIYIYICIWNFPGGSDGKASACNAGDLGLIPWLGIFPWRRKWQPTLVFLPGKSHGQRSLIGSWGRKELDTTNI